MYPVCNLTPDCRLEGKISTLPGNQKQISSFLGIPYAQPPVGPLRFQAPEPLHLWTGQRSAREFGAICPQNTKSAEITHAPFPVSRLIDENCLFLNVWTPKMDGKLPVMVWIHGGSFMIGFGDMYNGTALATFHDVVVVSINYRLGPFGFLCSGDGAIEGNMGLLDQLEALRFLKKHVAQFGGDPDNITLFGESAGSISIALHLVSPLAGGLFRRAICQSGAAAHPGSIWTQQQAVKYASKRLSKDGRLLSGKEMLQVLATKSSSELVRSMGDGFSPVLDNIYLPGAPNQLYNSPQNIHHCDVMIGFNSHEGAQFILALTKGQLIESKAQAAYMVDRIVKVSFFRGNPNADAIVAAILEYYLAGVGDEDKSSITAAMVDMYGDMLFTAATLAMLEQLAASGHPTWLYHYSYRHSMSSYPEFIAADHGHEIPMVMGEPFMGRIPQAKFTADDQNVSKLVMELWSSFARNGTPTSTSAPLWPGYNPRGGQCLDIRPHPSITIAPRQQAGQFWNRVIGELAAGRNQVAKY